VAALIHQILLVSDVPREHVRPEHICQCHLAGHCADHGSLLDSQ
jgi:hypothetical protein